jgi:hypothetical protein
MLGRIWRMGKRVRLNLFEWAGGVGVRFGCGEFVGHDFDPDGLLAS